MNWRQRRNACSAMGRNIVSGKAQNSLRFCVSTRGPDGKGRIYYEIAR